MWITCGNGWKSAELSTIRGDMCNKKKWITVGVFVIILAVISVFNLAFTLTATSNFGQIIVLDAGHGGIDGGVTDGGVREADITLKLALELQEVLENKGYRVVLTRTSNEALANGKRADMEARAKVINNIKPALVLSLHINKFASKSVRG